MNNHRPSQGDIWLFDPDPVKGNEIGKKIRPCVIVSNNLLNFGKSQLIWIIPMTSVEKGIPSHIRIESEISGLKMASFAICEQMRSISKVRLIKKFGKINSSLLEEIRSWIFDFISSKE